MIACISRRATDCTADERLVAGARANFERHHWVKLPRLVDTRLLEQVQDGVARATFRETHYAAAGPDFTDMRMESNAAEAMLELLVNDPAFLSLIERLTGCSGLVRFSGRVYRLLPSPGHHHDWHDDMSHGRAVAMSLNLGPERYAGGVLQLRERDSRRMLAEVVNTEPGDAVLFRISTKLQHRITDVAAGVKTAYAGWFATRAPLLEALKAAGAAAD